MRIIESDIVKIPKYDRLQGFNKEDKIMRDINYSLLEHFKNELPLKCDDEYIIRDYNSETLWDRYQFKAYILTEEEYENLRSHKSNYAVKGD